LLSLPLHLILSKQHDLPVAQRVHPAILYGSQTVDRLETFAAVKYFAS